MIRRLCMLILISTLSFSLVGYFTTTFARTPSSTVYGSYLGGDLPDYGRRIAIDNEGGVYIVGRSESTNFPTQTVPLAPLHGIDAFVAKFNPDGSQAEYILWLYTQVFFALDEADDIVVDDQGAAYVVGNTASDDFCTLFGTVPGYDTTYNGSGDAFLFKVRADGSGLVYCTFLGGSEPDRATAVTIDAAGNAYITGGTFSTDFITSSSTINSQPAGERDGFLLVVDAAGTAVQHASLFGGSSQEESKDIFLDEDQNVYITGWTRSDNFITTTGAVGPALSGDFDAFFVKINPVTPALLAATYLGGQAEDRGYSLQADPAGYAIIGGLTRSDDFPTTADAYDTALGGSSDGFAAKISPDGTSLAYASYVGGSQDDQINDMLLDEDFNFYATGSTQSTDFPTTTNAFMPTLTGSRSAFVVVLNPDGRQLEYGSYVGGSNTDQGDGIARDAASGRVYLTGATQSSDFPVSANAYDATHNGDYDAYFTSFVVTVTNDVLADFTAVPTNGRAPLTVQFTNLSLGENLTATWQFGDGQMSSQLNPAHTYTTPGQYTVTLTVTGPDGTNTLVRPHAIWVKWAAYLPVVLRP